MGTIVTRKRQNGSTAYMARIILQRHGKVHRETQTFDRQAAAIAWIKRRETELAEPGALDRKDDPVLATVIDRYIAESKHELGRTKKQVLGRIKADIIGGMRCTEIGSEQLLAFAQRLPCSPQTAGNYLSHLGAVFAVARPAWGYPLDQQAMRDVFVVGKKLGVTGRSVARERRPTLDELDRLMRHFGAIHCRRPSTVPMQQVVAFAIYSTRRQEEITRITWADLEPGRVMVRDMKHPGDKLGNDQWCDLVPEAERVLAAVPRKDERIFPYSTDAISAAFTRACKVLEIEGLRFHDLRHHGVSRLFEMGWSIPHAAAVSGHRSWVSLKRYTHLRQKGDCMAGWPWLDALA